MISLDTGVEVRCDDLAASVLLLGENILIGFSRSGLSCDDEGFLKV